MRLPKKIQASEDDFALLVTEHNDVVYRVAAYNPYIQKVGYKTTSHKIRFSTSGGDIAEFTNYEDAKHVLKNMKVAFKTPSCDYLTHLCIVEVRYTRSVL